MPLRSVIRTESGKGYFMDKTEIDWRSLWSSEDWWANWIGFTIFILAYLGVLYRAPRPELWTGNPLFSLTGETPNLLFVSSLCSLFTRLFNA
jgi:hypothetical protein